jgi:branched-chain amino acid transport system permease protein
MNRILGVVLLAAAIALAFLCAPFQLFHLTRVASYAIAILGLSILVGRTGQISLGHGAFYAIGAYITAILMSDYDWPFWGAIPVAAMVCGGFGFLLGFPALRLGGLYLALTTFAFAVVTPQVLKYTGLEDWTGGVQGLALSKPDAPAWTHLDQDQYFYLCAVMVTALMFVLAANLVRGRIGRAMIAVRDHALAAEAMGVDIALAKTSAFAVSAFYTGIAGGLGAIVTEFIAPDSFSVTLSIELFVGLIVGGVGSLYGALLGAAFVVLLPDAASGISKAAPGAVFGVILIALMYLMPSGLAGGIQKLFALARRGGATRKA